MKHMGLRLVVQSDIQNLGRNSLNAFAFAFAFCHNQGILRIPTAGQNKDVIDPIPCDNFQERKKTPKQKNVTSLKLKGQESRFPYIQRQNCHKRPV